MGKKYVIELEEKPFHDDNGDFLYRVKGFNSLVFDMNGIQKLASYTEADLDVIRKEVHDKCMSEAEDLAYKLYSPKIDKAYQRGLNDAWEAARKICTNWVLSDSVLSEIFGMDKTIDDIMKEITASEAIEKIREYEQKQEKKDSVWIANETWIVSEANEPSVDTTLICSKCGYAITIKPHETPALNFCPKCGDCKKPKEEES